MVQFVFETTEECRFKDDCEFAFQVRKYAQLLSQPPNIGMFVPAVCEDGVWMVLEEPEQYLGALEFAIGEDFEEAYKYQQAQAKVIFGGWEPSQKNNSKLEDIIYVSNKNKQITFFLKNNVCFFENILMNIIQDIHTLEDLVKFNLEMI